MRCTICGYLKHDGCCQQCIGHTSDGLCVTPELMGADAEELLT
jgi:hypothetical protein